MLNWLLRLLLVLWVLGYLVVACAPLLTGNPILGGLGFLAGVVLLLPWLVGVAILSISIWLTNPPRW